MIVRRYKNQGRSFFRFVTIHAFDRRTDGQTDKRTDVRTSFSSLIAMTATANGHTSFTIFVCIKNISFIISNFKRSTTNDVALHNVRLTTHCSSCLRFTNYTMWGNPFIFAIALSKLCYNDNILRKVSYYRAFHVLYIIRDCKPA